MQQESQKKKVFWHSKLSENNKQELQQSIYESHQAPTKVFLGTNFNKDQTVYLF